MKSQYDFSNGQRGKFHAPDAELRMPIYLEETLQIRLLEIAAQKGSDIATLVNDMLRNDIETLEGRP